ncbi:hypothetical protein Tco_0638993 [Tanacetum coccineum]
MKNIAASCAGGLSYNELAEACRSAGVGVGRLVAQVRLKSMLSGHEANDIKKGYKSMAVASRKKWRQMDQLSAQLTDELLEKYRWAYASQLMLKNKNDAKLLKKWRSKMHRIRIANCEYLECYMSWPRNAAVNANASNHYMGLA